MPSTRKQEAKRIRLETEGLPLSDFPNEILMKIFGYLTPNERLQVNVVNSRWYELMQTARLDVPLVLENCLLSERCPPWSVLRQSDRTFHHIYIGGKVDDSKCKDKVAMWKKLGKKTEILTMRSIDGGYSSLSYNANTVLKCLPKLKQLNIPTLDFLLHLKNVPKSQLSVHLMKNAEASVKVSKVKKLQQMKSLGQVKVLTTKSIKLNRAQMFEDIDVSFNFTEDEDSDTDTDDENENETYEEEYLVNLSSELKNVVKELKANHLQVGKLNLLETTEIQISDVTEFDWFASCSVEFKRNFQYSTEFRNLKVLQLTQDQDGCFFVHEAVPLRSVHSVVLNGCSEANLFCTLCLKNLNASCPLIDSWDFTSLSCVHIKTVLDSAPNPVRKLHLLHVTNIHKLPFNFPKLEKLWIIMTSIRHVRIKIPCKLPKLQQIWLFGTKISMQNLHDVAPNLTTMQLFYMTIKNLREIEKFWPKLKVLGFEVEFWREHGETCIKVLKGNFKELKVFGKTFSDQELYGDIAFDYPDRSSECRKHYDLFRLLPSLREMPIMSYKEFCNHEFFEET